MTEMVRVEEEERRGRRKRSEGEGGDEREKSEFSSRLPHDGSNLLREEMQGEKERRDGEVRLSISRKRGSREREGEGEGEASRDRGGERWRKFSPPHARIHARARRQERGEGE